MSIEPKIWQALPAIFPLPNAVIDLAWHEYDSSIELFFAPTVAAGWTPTEAQLKAVTALGPATVYCVFADETEFVGGLRNGPAKRDAVWVMSPRRERTGTTRYGQGRGEVRLLRGEDARLWPEFIAWKAALKG